jgi:MFS family permease
MNSRLFYGYIIVLAAFFIQVVGWGISNSFGVFFNPLLNEFGWLRATLSGAVSLGFLVHGLCSVFIGSFSDRFGPRRVMAGCGILLGLGYLLMAKVNATWQLYFILGLIIGIGQSGMDVIPLSTVARWFETKRGTMTGIVKVGTGIGMLICPIIISRLILVFGWRHAFMVLGLLVLVTIVGLAQFLVRDPEKKGLSPDNRSDFRRTDNQSLEEQGLSFRTSIRQKQFWLLCAVYFLILACVYTIIMHIVQHTIDLGFPAASAATVLSAIGGASIAGRFIMGFAGDRIGNRRALTICLFFLTLAMITVSFARQIWMFYLFASIYGFAHGGFFALGSPLVARLFGTRSHGTIFGAVIFASTIGGALGPIIAGHIFDKTGSYQFVFILLSVLSITSTILSLRLNPPSPHLHN